MAKGLSVEDVKRKKIDLEKQIFDLLREFEDETKIRVIYVDTIRERVKDKNKDRHTDEPVCCGSSRGKLKTVNLNVDLDLLF